MTSAVLTGIALNGGSVNSPGNEIQSYYTFFNQFSTSNLSHKYRIHESPLILRAFGLVDSEVDEPTVDILMVTETKTGELQQELFLGGKQVRLTSTNNSLLLDLSGDYRLRLNSNVPGAITVVGHESSLSYWSYGLSTFAQI